MSFKRILPDELEIDIRPEDRDLVLEFEKNIELMATWAGVHVDALYRKEERTEEEGVTAGILVMGLNDLGRLLKTIRAAKKPVRLWVPPGIKP